MVLQQGSRGSDVENLQRWLVENNFLSATNEVGANNIDGVYGPRTAAAVRAFQTAAGFTGTDVDGKFGPQTLEAKNNYTPADNGDDGDGDDGGDGGEGEDDETGEGTLDQTEVTVLSDDNNAIRNNFIASLSTIGISSQDALGMWDEMQENFLDPDYTMDTAVLDVYRTEAFGNRFPGIKNLMETRETSDNPTSISIPTVQEYLELERTVASGLDSLGGVPQGETFQSMIEDLATNGVNATDAQNRIDIAVRVAENAPQEIRDYFDANFRNGDSTLAAVFLDPDDSWSDIQEDVEAAEVGGWAEIYGGLELNTTQAGRLASLNMESTSLWDSFSQINAQSNAFIEKIGEEDITAEEEGIESVFFGDDSLERRIQSRVAQFSGGGGAMLTQEGTGLGGA